MELTEVKGLMTPEACEALRDLASEVPTDQYIVNIGVYKGQSVCWLAAGGGSHVVGIDPWDLDGNEPGRFRYDQAEAEAKRQIHEAGFDDRVTLIRGFSTEVAKQWDWGPVGLVFIDGDHSQFAVLADALAWSEHLASGGILVFDDYDTPKNPGVRHAVDHLAWSLEWGPTQIRAERLAVLRP